MNRICFNGSISNKACGKQNEDYCTIIFSNEYLAAQKIAELFNCRRDNRRLFMCFYDLNSIISQNDLVGMDIYLHLEDFLRQRAVLFGNEIIDMVNNMFFKYATHDIDSILKVCKYSRYDGWNMVSKVLYCIQPIFFHYVNEKEFIALWSTQDMEWKK